MSELDAARHWLSRAQKADKNQRIRPMALVDPDLKPLWPEIRGAPPKPHLEP